jgi:hypothetical protein
VPHGQGSAGALPNSHGQPTSAEVRSVDRPGTCWYRTRRPTGIWRNSRTIAGPTSGRGIGVRRYLLKSERRDQVPVNCTSLREFRRVHVGIAARTLTRHRCCGILCPRLSQNRKRGSCEPTSWVALLYHSMSLALAPGQALCLGSLLAPLPLALRASSPEKTESWLFYVPGSATVVGKR